ncbi:FAD-NAD(P)-binding-domain-containing protein [Xylaria flabelliformis]|nr:FAD-NAD(P)-binding-domain-containing protein [Xylaria flabelliformis]
MKCTEICIIGMAPRGTSTLERLSASVPEFILSGAQLKIHVVEPSPPGPGRVWRVDQSPELLMNTASCQVTLFTDSSVECSGPIVEGPCLYDWATNNGLDLGPNDYPTRAQHGRYLAWVFNYILRRAPTNVEIVIHTAHAVSLDNESSGLQTVTLSNGNTLSHLSVVILTQGHLPLLPNIEQNSSIEYAVKHGLRYILPSNPADLDLSSIAPNEPVLLRGLGLCFFDYMAMLTKGRGGRFESKGTGLRYISSGHEPLMYACSRRGIPYHARGDNQKGSLGRQFPVHITHEIIAHFRQRVKVGDAPNFRNEIWPLISKEVEFVYYDCMIGQGNPEFRSRFLATQLGNNLDAAQVLDEFHVSHDKRWSWDRISRPQGGRMFSTPEEWNSWLLEYLYSDVEEAALGNVSGPLKAALDMLRDLRNELRQIIDYNGLSKDSHRLDLDGWYSPLNAFLSVGPPRQRIQEMIALIEAGVLRILGPEPEVREKDGVWLARSKKVSNSTVRVTTLVDARLPQPNVRNTADRLLAHLLQTGQCRPHAVDGYETGGLDVSASHNLIDGQGRVHERRFALGIPLEGVQWVTAATARPGFNSVLLQNADMVARAALHRAKTDGDSSDNGVIATGMECDGLGA